MKRNWIIVCDGSDPEFPYGFACLRCGEKRQVGSRITIYSYVQWASVFTIAHSLCKPKPKTGEPND